MDKDFKVVEKKWHFFIVPVIALLIGVCFMLGWTLGTGSPFELGIDFAGGNAVTVEFGHRLTDESHRSLFNEINTHVGTFRFNGQRYDVNLNDNWLIQGSGYSASMRVTFDAVSGLDDGSRIHFNNELRDHLLATIFEEDPMGGGVLVNFVSSTIQNELIWNALLGLLVASVGMLVYIAFRFRRFLFGLATICALLHDAMIVFIFMAIFRVPISSTFIAVILTVIGYSINSNIILFDRVRENLRSPMLKDKPLGFVANLSVKETFTRTVLTTLTTILTVGLIAIIGVGGVREFMIPIIVGIGAGVFSTVCIVPGLWVTFENLWVNFKNKRAVKRGVKVPKKKQEVATN